MNSYSVGFEENDVLRSAFIRELTLQQLDRGAPSNIGSPTSAGIIPRRLIRYWHDPDALPQDVRACLDSWDTLRLEGFEFRMFNDVSAAAYIIERYSTLELDAFRKCRHPAMRCDYLRMCVLLEEGGLYVDADDVLLGEEWKYIFNDNRLKLQPLCYDIPSCGMVPAREIWRRDLPTEGRIFYVNNDPIAAPPQHPLLRRALSRATERLMGKDRFPEIQATTGPGNLTVCLAAHAHELMTKMVPFDFELLQNWDFIAETRWELSYRNDARNWRNMGSN